MKTDSGPRERIESALIVEDDPAMGATLADVMANAGYCAVFARDLDDARAAMRDDEPAVILLDLSLQESFGSDLLEEFARAEAPPLVIVISGFPLAHLVASRFGVELLRKPFSFDALEETLERARQRDSRPRRAG